MSQYYLVLYAAVLLCVLPWTAALGSLARSEPRPATAYAGPGLQLVALAAMAATRWAVADVGSRALWLDVLTAPTRVTFAVVLMVDMMS
jgi:hypothetical protein